MRFFAAFAAVAGLVLFSLPAVGGEPAPRSLQIIPEQQIPLTFSHTLHRTSGVACVVCHGSVQQSVQAADDNLPDHTICGLCHRMEQPAAAEMYPKAAATQIAASTSGSPSKCATAVKSSPEANKPSAIHALPIALT